MKKIFAALIATVLLIVCFASASAGTYGYVYFTGDCNVRTGPGRDYGIRGSVSSGSRLDYAGSYSYDNRGIAWYRVYYKNGTGWVSSMYGTLYENGSSYASRRVVATDGDTHVRSQPSRDAADLGILSKGDSLAYADDYSVDYRGVTWYCVWWHNSLAWVSSMYTSLY